MQNYWFRIDAATKLINFMDTGSTLNSHSVPALHLPKQENTNRILHLHKNTAGVINKINKIFSSRGINIRGQYLNTKDDIGYVVFDIEAQADIKTLMTELRGIEHTIKTRPLY